MASFAVLIKMFTMLWFHLLERGKQLTTIQTTKKIQLSRKLYPARPKCKAVFINFKLLPQF